MLESIFRGLFDSDMTHVISVTDFLLCLGTSLLMGAILALGFAFRSRYTSSFLITLWLLPAVVCVVIMMVNGNVGAGVAVAGAFSLVRFRSVPGSAKEITMLFLAMGAGLIAGMGYLAFAFLFTFVMTVFSLLLTQLNNRKSASKHKTLHITIPEDLDYSAVFDDILTQHAVSYELVQVKTTNLGSLFRLTYDLTLKDDHNEKEMIDALRCRNGNLEISLSRQETAPTAL